MKYSKEDIIHHLKSSKVGLGDGEAKELLSGFLNLLKQEISTENSVKFYSFGSFKKVKRASRFAKNFKTGEVIKTKEYHTITFIPSKLDR